MDDQAYSLSRALRQTTQGERVFDREDIINKVVPLFQALRLYHQHEVAGFNRVPREGYCLIVCNHSLATHDIVLLLTAIYCDIRRLPRPLIDRMFFELPHLREFLTYWQR